MAVTTGTIPKPDVFVQQVFEQVSPTLIPPALPACIVGLNNQVIYKKMAGPYDSAATDYAYPDLPLDAQVDKSGVLVYLTNKWGTFQLDKSDYIADDSFVTVDDNATVTRNVTLTSGTGVTTSTTSLKPFYLLNEVNGETGPGSVMNTFRDITVDFTDYNLRAGDMLFPMSGTDSGLQFTIVTVSTHTMTVTPSFNAIESGILYRIVREDATDGVTVAGSMVFASATSLFVTDNIKSGMSLYILEGADEGIYSVAAVTDETNLVIASKKGFAGFSNATGLKFRVTGDGSTFTDDAADFLSDNVAPGMTLIIESGVNAGSWRIEKVISDIELNLNQILLNTEHTGATSGSTFTDTGKDFSDLGVKVGDILVVEDGAAPPEVYGGYSITVVGTDTLTVSPAFAGVETGLDYRVVRKFTNANNVSYHIDDTTDFATGNILVSYTARRTDNVDDLVAVQNVDDVISKLGPIVPENPLAFGVWMALVNTDNIVYATAIENDSVEDWTAATEFLESREVYCIVPLTQDPAIHQIWNAHVTQQSAQENKHERIVMINRLLFIYETKASGTEGWVPDILTFNADDGDFINEEVAPGMIVKILDPDGVILHEARIVRVNNATTLELTNPGLPTSSSHDLIWRIDTKDYDKYEQAQYIADYSKAFSNRRVFNVWPDVGQIEYEDDRTGDDTFDTTSANKTGNLPGYYQGCIVSGMITFYPPQQPFTNVPVTGLIGLEHSNEYFNPSQLDIIATGGTYIFVQDTPTAPCYCRHQLSTDVTLIEKRELSITKDVDWVSKFIRNQLRPYIGKYNITTIYLEMLSTVVHGLLREFTENGQLMNANLVSLEQSTDQPDTVLVTIDILVPYPANYIRVTLQI